MRIYFLLPVTIVLLSCNSQKEVKTHNDPIPSAAIKPVPDHSVALKFINDYAKFISSKKGSDDKAWIAHDTLLTDNFKLAYKNLLDSAQKADPEMGLDFDPIIDAQDLPDKGFELTDHDSTGEYVSVSGKDQKEFILTLKVIHQNNKWLVDGAGVINIPIDKRAKR